MADDILTSTLTTLSESTAAAVADHWPTVAAWVAETAAGLPEPLRSEVVTVEDACAADPVIEDGVHTRVTTIATSHLPTFLADLRDSDPVGYGELAKAAKARKPAPATLAAEVLDHPLLSSFVMQSALRAWRQHATDTPLAAADAVR